MYRLIVLAAFFQCCISQQYQQKVPPGVPPQTYQQPGYQQPPPPPPPQMQQQQPPQQYQQQYQQPPQQQYQQQVPVQPVPVQQQQVPQGHVRHADPQLLNPANIKDEREHIQEHMDVPIDTSKMSEHELQFHYFKMHDADNNNKLDGCELIKSLIHWHGQIDKTRPTYSDEQIEQVLEHAFKHTDTNKDGYIDYLEYKMSSYIAKAKGNGAR